MKNKISLVLVGLVLVFSGCSGGGSGSSSENIPSVETVSGKFIDSPVEGLDYECSSSTSGITNSEGLFTCNEGDTVTFKISGIILGSSSVSDYISPLHLYPNDKEKAYNVAQLLHSLDNDNNPDNNIKIDTDLLSNISLANVDVQAESNTFQNSLASSLATAGKTSYNREQSAAKMLSYINTIDSISDIQINITNELTSLETLMCSSSQKLLTGECQEKTCEADSYGCPTCTVNESLVYGTDGSGSCEEKTCSEGQKLENGQCIAKTCEADSYGCPTCTVNESLVYGTDGSGSCESKPLVLNTNYTATDGLSVKMNSINTEEKTGSYVYTINYTLTNNTTDKEIDEGSFKAFYKNKDGGLPQYGGFGKLFPGDTQSRSYDFETLKTEPFGTVSYGDLFFADNPASTDLVWSMD